MRRIALLLLFSILCIAPATAEIVKLQSSPSVGELRGACSRAGGTFSIHIDGGGYGCTVANCDGKGGQCTIACDNNNNCNGDTPSRQQQGTTLFGLLQNGNNVYHEPKDEGPSSLVDNGPGSNVIPPEPVKPPPVLL